MEGGWVKGLVGGWGTGLAGGGWRMGRRDSLAKRGWGQHSSPTGEWRMALPANGGRMGRCGSPKLGGWGGVVYLRVEGGRGLACRMIPLNAEGVLGSVLGARGWLLEEFRFVLKSVSNSEFQVIQTAAFEAANTDSKF